MWYAIDDLTIAYDDIEYDLKTGVLVESPYDNIRYNLQIIYGEYVWVYAHGGGGVMADPGMTRRNIEDIVAKLNNGDYQPINGIVENKMRITQRQLKQIIREEYTRLKRQGLIKENHRPNGTILDLASQPGGVHIDELVSMFGEEVFETIDELEASGLIYMEDDGTVVSLRGY